MSRLKLIIALVLAVILSVAPAAAAGKNNYNCANGVCTCTGDKDCNDMFSGNACGKEAVCDETGTVKCYCAQSLRHRLLMKPGAAAPISKPKLKN